MSVQCRRQRKYNRHFLFLQKKELVAPSEVRDFVGRHEWTLPLSVRGALSLAKAWQRERVVPRLEPRGLARDELHAVEMNSVHGDDEDLLVFDPQERFGDEPL